MLNTMRRNLKSLSWVLWLTVASFVIAIFAVWGRAGDVASTSANWMARVNGDPVSVPQFQNAYYNLDRFYRQIYQQNYDPRSLGVARQALNQLIRDKLILDEARRLGLAASPREISQAITRDPTFQVDGRFIGVAQYKRFLQDRGIDISAYERGVAENLLAEKYRRLVTDSISVSAEEVLADYRSRNEKVKADYMLLNAEKLGSQVSADEDALRAFFASHRQEYQTSERRRSSYVLINQDRLGTVDPVSEEKAREYYQENLDRLYSTPVQVRASQILLKVPSGSTPEEEAEVRARAEDLLLRVRSGEDFAELARTYSEDTSQSLGGDLGFFERGRMRPALEDAAYSLAVGETSDLVRTQAGFHIIRVTDRREAAVQPFEDVRDAIIRQLEFGRAQEAVSKAVESFREEVDADPSRFDAAADRLGLTVEDTGLLSAGDSVEGLGAFPQIVQSIFQVDAGQVSPPVIVPQGTVFLRTTEIRPPEPLSFELARPHVEVDYRREQGVERARLRIQALVETGADLAGLAKALDATVQSTTEFTRRMTVAPFTAEARRLAFLSPEGKVAPPVQVPDGLLVFTVTQHQGFDRGQFDEIEGNLERSLLQRRRNLLFNAVVDHLRAESEIQVNQARLDQIEGRGA